MKTFDGIELVKKHLAQALDRYPEGSLTPREVMITLPILGDPREMIERVNFMISRAVIRKVNDHLKTSQEKKKPLGFSKVSDYVSDDRIKRETELSNLVLKSLSDFNVQDQC
jgi:hypothetical protein